MNSDEIWKPVAGYENLYEVSSLGRVRSLARMTKRGRRGGHVLRPAKHRDGYLLVGLSKNGKQKMCTVHRLVATAHVPNPQKLPEVNHKNELKDDNRAVNLEWCDRYYNMTYGSLPEKFAERSREVFQYTMSGEFVAWYPSVHEAAQRTGVCVGSIAQCARGGCNTQGGFQWSYAPALFLDATEGRLNDAHSKRVYQYDAQTGRFVKEWASTQEVQRQTGWGRGNICKCCNSQRNTAYGFRWFYSFQGYKISV